MKKYVFIYGWLLLSPLGLFAQEIAETTVPSSVKSTLRIKFPKATDTDWKKRGNQCKASFDQGHVDHDALFSSSGQLIAYEQDIPDSDLLTAVKTAIAKQFPAYGIGGADKREEGGRITYKVELDGTPDLKVIVSVDGKVLKKMTDAD